MKNGKVYRNMNGYQLGESGEVAKIVDEINFLIDCTCTFRGGEGDCVSEDRNFSISNSIKSIYIQIATASSSFRNSMLLLDAVNLLVNLLHNIFLFEENISILYTIFSIFYLCDSEPGLFQLKKYLDGTALLGILHMVVKVSPSKVIENKYDNMLSCSIHKKRKYRQKEQYLVNDVAMKYRSDLENLLNREKDIILFSLGSSFFKLMIETIRHDDVAISWLNKCATDLCNIMVRAFCCWYFSELSALAGLDGECIGFQKLVDIQELFSSNVSIKESLLFEAATTCYISLRSFELEKDLKIVDICTVCQTCRILDSLCYQDPTTQKYFWSCNISELCFVDIMCNNIRKLLFFFLSEDGEKVRSLLDLENSPDEDREVKEMKIFRSFHNKYCDSGKVCESTLYLEKGDVLLDILKLMINLCNCNNWDESDYSTLARNVPIIFSSLIFMVHFRATNEDKTALFYDLEIYLLSLLTSMLNISRCSSNFGNDSVKICEKSFFLQDLRANTLLDSMLRESLTVYFTTNSLPRILCAYFLKEADPLLEDIEKSDDHFAPLTTTDSENQLELAYSESLDTPRLIMSAYFAMLLFSFCLYEERKGTHLMDDWEQELPRKSWWLCIRILNAFLVVRNQIGSFSAEIIKPIVATIQEMKQRHSQSMDLSSSRAPKIGHDPLSSGSGSKEMNLDFTPHESPIKPVYANGTIGIKRKYNTWNKLN